jgi:glycosyltransferase involved in cell wall biosynthesis
MENVRSKHNNKEALVSIGIPVYNGAAYIEATLESVQSQSYPNIELFIIDDSSTDSSLQIIKRWVEGKDWVTVLSNPSNLGIHKTSVRLLSLFNGKYFQLLAHDDILMANKISRQVLLLNSLSTDTVLVFSDCAVIDQNGSIIEESYLKNQGYDLSRVMSNDIINDLLLANFIPAPTFLMRSSAIGDLHYDESIYVDDLFLWLGLAKKYKFYFEPSILAAYRRSPLSIMHNPGNKIKIFISLLKGREQYRGYKKEWDKTINKGLYSLAPEIYRYDKSAGKYWLRQRLKYNKDLKSYIYFFISRLGLSYFWK